MKFKSKVLLVAALVWISSGTPSSALAQSDSATLRGSVVNLSGKPGTSLTIQLWLGGGQPIAQTETNASGEFQFVNLQPGSYTVNAGWRYSAQVQLGKGESVRHNIVDSSSGVPQDAPMSLSGRVSDIFGIPIRGVAVTATNKVTRTITSTITTSGSYSFPYLEPGTYAVSASLAGFETFSANIELANAATIQKSITLLLPCNGTCSMIGRVTDVTAAAIPGVIIIATNNVSRTITKTITTDFGNYSFPRLEPGTYTVTASLSGFDTFSANVELANASAVQKNITLSITRGGEGHRCPPGTPEDVVCLH